MNKISIFHENDKKRKYIISKTDKKVVKTCVLYHPDDYIIIPKSKNTYQFLIKAEDEITEIILVDRILQELYLHSIIDSVIEIHEMYISENSKTVILNLLKNNNTIYCFEEKSK